MFVVEFDKEKDYSDFQWQNSDTIVGRSLVTKNIVRYSACYRDFTSFHCRYSICGV